MVHDAALASVSSDGKEATPEERPKCPLCGTPLVARGKNTQRQHTQGGQDVALSRSDGVCSTCQRERCPPG
jgi:hypothetical protein